ncbi:hypothetical protein F4778DRAFT_250050 [Xylariomycetidae sp. FL2044]|nr:hypothetical protein F4778DRAFT_250050 [Xylariomycetidae sp. FL2044]
MHIPTPSSTTITSSLFFLPLFFTISHAHPLFPLQTQTQKTAARGDVPPEVPRITSLSYSGTGCPSSSSPSSVTPSGGFDDLTLKMNNFVASLPLSSNNGNGGGLGSSTANCQVHIQAAGTAALGAGWQVGIKEVYVRGHLVLDPGARLDSYVTSFWSEDAGNTVTIQSSLPNTGGSRLDTEVTAHTSIPADRVVWSACTGPDGSLGILNVNFRAALGADGGDGDQYAYFGKEAVESWDYVWRRC